MTHLAPVSTESLLAELKRQTNRAESLAHAIRELLTKGREDFRWQGSTWTLPLAVRDELSLVLKLNSDAQ